MLSLAAAPGLAAGGTGGAPKLTLLRFADLPGWGGDDLAAARAAFAATCDRIGAGHAALDLSPADWAPPCARAVKPGDARAFFEAEFAPVRIGAGRRSLITGYFEPELRGARARGGDFQHPILRPPPGAGRSPLTRAQIAAGGLDGLGLEIAYLTDPVEVFFLHVQGSGRIVLPDGEVLRVGYAGRNAHPYRSIGKIMKREGIRPPGGRTAQGIRAWVRADPARGLAMLNRNPSYIFFREARELAPDDGPAGALGAPLRAMRSIAVDPAFAPLGAPIWLETETPLGALRRLMVAQDTGAAIKGAQRADLFFGSGASAGAAAGRMKARGRLVALIPRAAADRLFPAR